MKKVDSNIEQSIIDEYRKDKSMKCIGNLYELSVTTVFNILKRSNIETRTKGGIYKIDENKVVNMYKQGQSSSKIAEYYNVSCHTITNILEKNGVKRDNIYYNINLIGDYWECINTLDKAYFLGFLLTDGNISGNYIRLQLSSKDEHILYTFANKTQNGNKIYKDKRGLVSFGVKRKKWVDDLKQYGIIPNKTYNVKLPIVKDNMLPHLLRGIIDGDGWISSKAHQLGICGTEELVTEVRNIFVEKLNVYNVKILHTEEHLWQATWASTSDIKKIGEYIYKSKEDCFLKRKYDEYLKIIHVNTEVSQEITQGF